MGAEQVVVRAVKLAQKWLVGRSPSISKHIFAHAQDLRKLAARNPNFARKLRKVESGLTKHTRFRSPNIKKLATRALDDYARVTNHFSNASAEVLQKALEKEGLLAYFQPRTGNILLQKTFGRAIGQGGERVLRIAINPRTGAFVTSFAAALLEASAAAQQAPELTPLSSIFDEYLGETIQRVQNLMGAEPRERQEDIFTFVLDICTSATPAGSPNERIYLSLERLIINQTNDLLEACDKEFGPLSDSQKEDLRQAFREAINGLWEDGGW